MNLDISEGMKPTKVLRRCATTVMVFLLFACFGASSAAASSPASFQELAAQFEIAHQNQDIDALRRFVYWNGVDETTRKSFERHTQADFGLAIREIVFEKLLKDKVLEYTLGGITYRPNLRPIGRMRVKFLPAKGTGQIRPTSTSYLVGIKDGTYLIVLAAPVAR